MGLFDIFKKRKNAAANPGSPNSEFFLLISRYKEYIVRYMGMQMQGNYSPISAYEKLNGEIAGFLYFISTDISYQLSVEEVINQMEVNFNKKMIDNEIKSYVILYHSQFNNDNNHVVAHDEAEFKGITIEYNFSNGIAGKMGLTYKFENNEIKYGSFQEFRPKENDIIFNTQLVDGKNYFQDKEEFKAPFFDNESGIRIKKSNSLDLNNTWYGITGFESARKPTGGKIYIEHFALVMTQEPVLSKNDIVVTQLEYEDVIIKGITRVEKTRTIIPVVKTVDVVDVVNKEIAEWENVDNLIAIITGGGRDTFGLSYLATDYAENRYIYHSQKTLKIKISGIIFVLDISGVKDTVDGVKFGEGFTGYIPNKDLPDFACFDFEGKLEDFKETRLLENNLIKGYILKVKIITEYENNDAFIIDMFVNQENMRFQELTKGMKIAGMVQMQGQISG